MRKTALPSAERLWAIFDYDPLVGVLMWKVRPRGKAFGSLVAGGLNSQGYIVTRVDGKIVRVHRIIFKMMTGREPQEEIDHKDLDRSNNLWGNIREATSGQNKANMNALKCSSSGLRGAFFDKRRGTYYSQIKKGGIVFNLGSFITAQEAHEAYMRKSLELYGEFCRGAK